MSRASWSRRTLVEFAQSRAAGAAFRVRNGGLTNMADGWSTQKLLDLRKLTRSVADALRNDLAEHLATLLPLVRPRTLLGSYVQGAPKDSRRSDKAFKDLQSAYDSVASAKPFTLPRDLKAPI